MENRDRAEFENKPTLLIMAAGLGSRFKGNKQTAEMTEGEWLMDYSLYDAYMAGFENAVIVIKKEFEDKFREHLDSTAGKRINIQYAFQDMDDTLGVDIWKLVPPENKSALEEREKPWGTAHAVLSARDLIQGPFAVINADDFYGSTAFSHMYDFLSGHHADGKEHYAMVGYKLNLTLSETGSVSRGVCSIDQDSMLLKIDERKKINYIPGSDKEDGAKRIGFADGLSEEEMNDPAKWTPLDSETIVSMNFWGFSRSLMDHLEEAFPEAIKEILDSDPKGEEVLLPIAVDKLLQAGKADVKVIPTSDRWYGVTNKEDHPLVKDALQSMKDKQVYPTPIWSA